MRIIQYLSLKFIPFRFCIWKLAKTKSLSLMAKKGTLIVNMPICHVKVMFVTFSFCQLQIFLGIICVMFMKLLGCNPNITFEPFFKNLSIS
jgi:hypothetical protein